MPWEDYIGTYLPTSSRLPKNFKTFDYFDDITGKAISAKTLDTTTAAKIKNPEQIYHSLTSNIDAAADFTSYSVSNVNLTSSMIKSKEIQLAIPAKTNSAQWEQINRAIKYGNQNGVKVIVTEVK